MDVHDVCFEGRVVRIVLLAQWTSGGRGGKVRTVAILILVAVGIVVVRFCKINEYAFLIHFLLNLNVLFFGFDIFLVKLLQDYISDIPIVLVA